MKFGEPPVIRQIYQDFPPPKFRAIRYSIFKPATRRRPARTWFLKIDPVWIVSMRGCVCACVFVCVCVRTRGY